MLFGHDEGKNLKQLCNGKDDVVCVEMGGTGVKTKGEIGLMAYPVGAVYMSYEETSPAELFGGTWTPIKGVFPYFNAGTETGGSNTHTLTVAQMPAHNHTFRSGWAYSGNQQGIDAVSNLSSFKEWPTTATIKNTGGDEPHNNMPAYQTFYAWRRIA